ncbi:hypothetical protein [Methylobacterium sp. Leaf117]|uniref:hypothetical protein n=1 Tax=Methylobacterium sp. Leaf117 TaxID=1736260 RepID=UPI0012E185A3|nr:hypothetical protein [Methylobacterium sp. Leaf117]
MMIGTPNRQCAVTQVVAHHKDGGSPRRDRSEINVVRRRRRPTGIDRISYELPGRI